MLNSKRLIIIDGLNSFYRSYVVDPSVSINGQHIGGCKGFLKQLQKSIREIKPDEVVVAWDGKGGSQKRKELVEDYKDGRKPIVTNYNRNFSQMTASEEEESKIKQLQRLLEYLNVLPVHQLFYEGTEADDIISFVKNHEIYADWEKVIISNDKDFFQLLDDKTILFRSAKRGKNKYVTEKDILNEYKIHPTNFALARSVVGDPSDNLPGIERVGLKTFAKCFPDMSNSVSFTTKDLYELCKTSKGSKFYQSILDGKEIVEINYEMMQLKKPSLTEEMMINIEENITSDNLSFNQTKFRTMTLEDGFGEYNWSSLEASMKRFSKKGK